MDKSCVNDHLNHEYTDDKYCNNLNIWPFGTL
jgi:hypothetical protein